MEILKGHTGIVKFVVPSTLTTATYEVYRDTTVIGSASAAVVENGVATVTMPYAAVAEEGSLRVILTFTFDGITYTPEKAVTVVTPYIDLYEVKEILDTTDDKAAADAERMARHIINAHTGQSFGRSTKTVVIRGDGNRSMKLPERLISFTNVQSPEAEYNTVGFGIASDGWYLRFNDRSILRFKEMPSDYSLDHGPVIQTPFTSWYAGYRGGMQYAVTGVWGYQEVPEPVKEAARLLIEDYSCMEVGYRDKYLESIKAADWRLQFSSRSWEFTGNVRADQLLADYVLLNWVVI